MAAGASKKEAAMYAGEALAVESVVVLCTAELFALLPDVSTHVSFC